MSVGARTATIRRDGRVVRQVRVGVGRPSYPTPRGLFAIAEKFETSQPGVGRWVLALTAHSEVLTSFAGGPGLIALHGRSNPAGPVAAYSSHGCVVFDNAQVAWLMRTLPEGTPVLIR